MKLFYQFNLLLPALFTWRSVLAQCPPGNITFSTQTEIDNFGVNWPNCNTVSGNLTLNFDNASDVINDLTQLSNLQVVQGELRLSTNFAFANAFNLDALENISSVGSLVIGSLPAAFPPGLWISSLVPLSGISGELDEFSCTGARIDEMGSFENITAIKNLHFTSCPFISEIPEFPNLTFLRHLQVQGTGVQTLVIPPSITTFSTTDGNPPPPSQPSGLFVSLNSQLNSIICESKVEQMFDIYIMDNHLLSSLSGFDSLRVIDRTLEMEARSPEVFNSFHNLERARGLKLELLNPPQGTPLDEWNITIGQNATEFRLTSVFETSAPEDFDISSFYVTSMHFHANLTEVQGDFYLTGPQMTEVLGFENLVTVEGDFDLDLVAINPLPDFTGLTYIGRSLNLEWNMASFENLSGLDNLQHIEQMCRIGGTGSLINNTAFQSLDGLESLNYIGDGLRIGALPNLSDISAVTDIDTIDGLIHMHTLPALVSNDITFQNLQTISSIRLENLSMETLPSFPEMTTMSGTLIIADNEHISEISGFPNLLSVNQMRIQDNVNLTEIFCNADVSVNSGFELTGNAILNDCSSPCICRLVDSAFSNEIADNGPSCGDENEILSACLLSADNTDSDADLRIWLDAHGNLNLESNKINGNGTLDIYDISGRLLSQENLPGNELYFQTPFPLAAPGIYLVEYKTETGRFSQKVFWNK